MRLISTILVVIALSGCSSLMEYIPSFSDGNQSARIIDVRQDIESIQCGTDSAGSQVRQALRDAEWFELYSESLGPRQTDVRRLVKPLLETLGEMDTRYTQGPTPSKAYCQIKVSILRAQARRAAEAILGRF